MTHKLSKRLLFPLFILQATFLFAAPPEASTFTLRPEAYRHYFDTFAAEERDFLGIAPPVQWNWFAKNIPLIDVPDKQFEEIYYFRWYAFQKHIKMLPDSTFVIDEFLDDVSWAGDFNAINDSAEHHLREARWLRDSSYANQDAEFWLGSHSDRHYSLSTASAVYQVYLATGDRAQAVSLLPRLILNNAAWNDHRDANGLYWSIDDRDAMEKSISGNGYRPTLNSYMFADALAISRIAQLAGDAATARNYLAKSDRLRDLIETTLWNPNDDFYEVVPREAGATWSGVREEIGYIPWAYYEPSLNFPAFDRVVAWKQITDPHGFAAPYGPTTAERRNPHFMAPNKHECLWNGPSWPFATTQTLIGMANVLNGPTQKVIRKKDYFDVLQEYVLSQHIKDKAGKVIPWIDEDLNADTGEWIARETLEARHQPPANRGRYYNHSGFADLVITGLFGIRPSSGSLLRVNPLLPDSTWSYFVVHNVPYHGHLLTLVYDKAGERYHHGVGLKLYCDGRVLASSMTLAAFSVQLPARTH